jgi:catechol 2,3-dioxygenase-like lactoylglutathione lyase family enzyme
MTVPGLAAFHIAFVVRDLDAVMERYRATLGVELWRVRDGTQFPVRLAYGRGAAMTFELIQPRSGEPNQFSEFLDMRGEGVQHIGLWTLDVRASVEAALAAGATLVSASTDASGNTAVQLLPKPGDPPPDLTSLRPFTFVDLGLGGVRIEYVGAEAGVSFLKDWLGDDYPKIVTPPPW